MSISTKSGDCGETSLMFGRRVSKNSARVCAYGAVDELSGALGLARSFSEDSALSQSILKVQKALISLMTELATAPEDFEKLLSKNIPLISEDDLSEIETQIAEIESDKEILKKWHIPGGNKLNAALNLARTSCRRAEREVAGLDAQEPLPRKMPAVYLNRLSDLIFLWSAQN